MTVTTAMSSKRSGCRRPAPAQPCFWAGPPGPGRTHSRHRASARFRPDSGCSSWQATAPAARPAPGALGQRGPARPEPGPMGRAPLTPPRPGQLLRLDVVVQEAEAAGGPAHVPHALLPRHLGKLRPNLDPAHRDADGGGERSVAGPGGSQPARATGGTAPALRHGRGGREQATRDEPVLTAGPPRRPWAGAGQGREGRAALGVRLSGPSQREGSHAPSL